MEESDPACRARGIPEHLHTNARMPQSEFGEGERLFRRFRPQRELAESVSFDRDSSSSVRSTLCKGAEDALWNCEEGGRYETHGVLSLPANIFEGRVWRSPEPADFTIEVFHCPTQCNFAHTDFQIFKDGHEILRIKPGSVKLMIREFLTAEQAIKVEIDPPHT
jgi:hypothetical protein